MKKLLAFFLAISLFTTTNASSLETEMKPEKRVPIDIVLTAANGCEYRAVGWVDLNLNPMSNNFLGINSYDFTVTSPCGNLNIHFNGMIAPSNDEDDANAEEISEATLKLIITDIIGDKIILN